MRPAASGTSLGVSVLLLAIGVAVLTKYAWPVWTAAVFGTWMAADGASLKERLRFDWRAARIAGIVSLCLLGLIEMTMLQPKWVFAVVAVISIAMVARKCYLDNREFVPAFMIAYPWREAVVPLLFMTAAAVPLSLLVYAEHWLLEAALEQGHKWLGALDDKTREVGDYGIGPTWWSFGTVGGLFRLDEWLPLIERAGQVIYSGLVVALGLFFAYSILNIIRLYVMLLGAIPALKRANQDSEFPPFRFQEPH